MVRGLGCWCTCSGIAKDELFSGTAEWLARCQTYEGGMGGEQGNEAHGGYTFCGVAALALLGLVRLASISGDRAIDDFVENALTEPALEMEQAPHAFPTLLRAVALRTRGSSVAVIVGDSDDPRTIALADRARRVLRPEDAVLVSEPNAAPPDEVAAEWLLGREPVGGRPTAYLCRGSTCSLPVHEPAELVADLLSQT